MNSIPYSALPAIHAELTSHRRLSLLLQEKVKEWRQRLGCDLRLQIEELTGDTDSIPDVTRMDSADVICTTPEKFGAQPMLSTLLFACHPVLSHHYAVRISMSSSVLQAGYSI